VHGVACDKLKSLFVSGPVLAYFVVTNELTVQCDACQGGLGAVMIQGGRPVEYASRAMTLREQNYAQIEKELLAIIFGMERFNNYLYAHPHKITVETDHKPLISINRKALSSAPKRLQRMLLRLQRYMFDLVFRPGSSRKHTTSSPRYPASNGRAENAVKTAKRLILKASESQCDPYMALLDWRNTP